MLPPELLQDPKKEDHVSDILKSFRWLPVHARIQHKILLLMYEVINGLAPSYLSDFVSYCTTSRCLRSTEKGLAVPHTNSKTYRDRAFCVARSELWNTLLLDLKTANSGYF